LGTTKCVVDIVAAVVGEPPPTLHQVLLALAIVILPLLETGLSAGVKENVKDFFWQRE